MGKHRDPALRHESLDEDKHGKCKRDQCKGKVCYHGSDRRKCFLAPPIRIHGQGDEGRGAVLFLRSPRSHNLLNAGLHVYLWLLLLLILPPRGPQLLGLRTNGVVPRRHRRRYRKALERYSVALKMGGSGPVFVFGVDGDLGRG